VCDGTVHDSSFIQCVQCGASRASFACLHALRHATEVEFRARLTCHRPSVCLRHRLPSKSCRRAALAKGRLEESFRGAQPPLAPAWAEDYREESCCQNPSVKNAKSDGVRVVPFTEIRAPSHQACNVYDKYVMCMISFTFPLGGWGRVFKRPQRRYESCKMPSRVCKKARRTNSLFGQWTYR
jgi:hypothetical protein